MTQKFLWGVASSSHQTEGNNQYNDWWDWEHEGKIEGGVRSGLACDFRNRFKEDLLEIKNLGCNSFRFSVEWSRVEPEKGQWNELEIAFYKDLVLECKKLGIEPMVTLHHFSIPLWFYRQGGFTRKDSHVDFIPYVKKMVEVIGEDVHWWCTINEPIVYTLGAYFAKYMPPGEFNPAKVVAANYHLFLSHREAYRIIKEKNQQAQVGIAHNMLAIRPSRKWHLLERIIANAIDRFYNWAWIDAITGGKVCFSLPFIFPKHSKITAGKCCDFLGVNYYTQALVHLWPKVYPHETSLPQYPVAVTFARRSDNKSDLGWSIYPKGLLKILRRLEKFKLPIFITENGIADKADQHRPKYLVEHLRILAEARNEGIDVAGYFHWSIYDNFEWIKGFGPCFGLLEMNYETQERSRRPSAELFTKIILSHEHAAPSLEKLKLH
ncbi:MAG: glycoside hydrolase family 1 protein [Pseudobdellovibrionaceae bacterium]